MNTLQLAFDAFRRNDAAETERLCKKILAEKPADLNALQLLAEVYASTRRPGEAIDVFRQMTRVTHSMLEATTVEHGLNTLRSLNWRPQGILDVGAHSGDWTAMVRHFFPDAFFLMIEAQPNLVSKLEEIAAANPDKIAFQQALMGPERRDAVDFFQMEGVSTGSSMYAEQTDFERTVVQLPMLPLDDVVAEFPNRKFQLLKLDVQGAELDVLAGATKALADIEVIITELSIVEYNKGAPRFADVVSALREKGFLPYDVFSQNRHRTGALIQVDAFFVHKDSAIWLKPPFY